MKGFPFLKIRFLHRDSKSWLKLFCIYFFNNIQTKLVDADIYKHQAYKNYVHS